MTLDPVVFSALETVAFTPPGSPRSYMLAPLSYRQRIAFRAALAREAGVRPSQKDESAALRTALRDLAPANLDELLAVVDAVDAAHSDVAAEPKDVDAHARLAEAQARLAVINTFCMDAPVCAELRAAGERWSGMLPWVACRHMLRGWEGPGLPAFKLEKGMAPEDMLDAMPPTEIEVVGYQAVLLMSPDRNAVGNSEAPSPAPETPKDSPEG